MTEKVTISRELAKQILDALETAEYNADNLAGRSEYEHDIEDYKKESKQARILRLALEYDVEDYLND